MIRRHYYADGMVQGVGFRYRAYYTAQNLGLTGSVRNLYDGRVEVELQGDEETIGEFWEKMQQGHWIRITNLESRDMKTDPAEVSFSILDDD